MKFEYLPIEGGNIFREENRCLIGPRFIKPIPILALKCWSPPAVMETKASQGTPVSFTTGQSVVIQEVPALIYLTKVI